jgi:hypothetical protein
MSSRVKILRLVFWIFWSAAIGFPLVALLTPHRSMVGIGAYAYPICSIGLCFVSAELVEEQPNLARFGMVNMAISILFCMVPIST